MTVHTSATTAISIDNAAANPATDDLAGVAALTYTLIGNVEDGGEYGATSEVVEFTPLDTAIVEKVSGSINLGELSLTIAVDEADAGQAAAKAAVYSRRTVYVKIDLPDGTGGRTTEYLRGTISQFSRKIGTADDIAMFNCTINIAASYS